jgi:hypothetical protein
MFHVASLLLFKIRPECLFPEYAGGTWPSESPTGIPSNRFALEA